MSIRSTKSARTRAHSLPPTSSAEAPRRRPTATPAEIADRTIAQLNRLDRQRVKLPPALAEAVDRAIDVLSTRQPKRPAPGVGPNWLELGGHGRAFLQALRLEHERTNDARCSSIASGVEAIAGILGALAKGELAGVQVSVKSEVSEVDGSTHLRVWFDPLSHRSANHGPAFRAVVARASAAEGRHARA